MKICSKCKAEKPLTEFSARKDSKDGLKGVCRACIYLGHLAYISDNQEKLRIYYADRYRSNVDAINVINSNYRKANAEKIKAARAIYLEANKEKTRVRQAAYRASNPEKARAYQSAYVAKNPEKFMESQAAWRSANPDKVSARQRNRRARFSKAEGKHAAADVRLIFEGQRGLCANCQTKLFKSGKQKYHVDHIMPLALGGSNWPSNLQCLCPACNLSKGAKHPDDWAREQGRLI